MTNEVPLWCNKYTDSAYFCLPNAPGYFNFMCWSGDSKIAIEYPRQYGAGYSDGIFHSLGYIKLSINLKILPCGLIVSPNQDFNAILKEVKELNGRGN